MILFALLISSDGNADEAERLSLPFSVETAQGNVADGFDTWVLEINISTTHYAIDEISIVCLAKSANQDFHGTGRALHIGRDTSRLVRIPFLDLSKRPDKQACVITSYTLGGLPQ